MNKEKDMTMMTTVVHAIDKIHTERETKTIDDHGVHVKDKEEDTMMTTVVQVNMKKERKTIDGHGGHHVQKDKEEGMMTTTVVQMKTIDEDTMMTSVVQTMMIDKDMMMTIDDHGGHHVQKDKEETEWRKHYAVRLLLRTLPDHPVLISITLQPAASAQLTA